MKKFNCQDLIENFGFKKMYSSDGVWERQHGFEYFVVWKDLPKDFSLQFDILTREVELLNCDSQGSIMSRHKVESRTGLIDLLNVLDPGNKYPIQKEPKVRYGYSAC